MVDIGFLVDSSGSISPSDWSAVLNALQRFVDSFLVSAEGSRFSVISYSSEPYVDFRFNTLTGDRLNNKEVKKLIGSIKHQKGYTFMDKALGLADSDMFSTKGGMRAAARKVRGPSKPF